MYQSRRNVLNEISFDENTNAGLWLDKYITEQLERNENVSTDELTPQAKLVKEVSKIKIPVAYKKFYERWTETLEKAGAKTEIAKAQGRIAIDLGAESVLETSVCLHYIYGLPYIPGSALKGLATHYAHNQLGEKWDEGSEAYKIMFGDTTSAGYVTFFDALYIPKGKGLWPDIITVHHPEYYKGKNIPPADWDSPTPIPFLSATGDYLIALSGPDEWVETAFEILSLALKKLGVGAKTSSGYGRMLLGEEAQKAQEILKSPETYHEAKLRLLKKETPPPGRERNVIREVHKDGAYGFMNSLTGGRDIYIKHEYFRDSGQALQKDQIIEYQRVETDRGPQARDVVILQQPD